MSHVEQLEQEVKKLTREELAAFDAWYQEYLADEWDRQFERDVQAGKLDRIADEVRRDVEEGRFTEL
jgi:hypothetical protein